MRVLIAGAGSVGMAVAAAASRDNSVVVMENNAQRADAAQNEGVSVYRGDASNPKELKSALERFRPEIVITAVDKDGINLFICSAAKMINPNLETIAAIRDSDYIMNGHIPSVDKVIAPRITTAKKIARCAMLENAVIFSNPFGQFYSAVFRIDPGSDICGKYVMDVKIDECVILAIYRAGGVSTSIFSSEIRDNDRVLVAGSVDALVRFNELVGRRRTVRNVAIIGAGEMGIMVANAVRTSAARLVVKVLDSDLDLCNNAARRLKGTVVINGQTSDPSFLRSENVDRTDVVIAVSDSEQTNLLSCVNAVRFGVRKIITVYNTEEYGNLLRYSGLESLVGYHNVIVNEISSTLNGNYDRSDSSYILDRPKEAFLRLVADEALPFNDKYLGDIYLPEGTRLVLIIRNGKTVYPDMLERIRPKDVLIFYVSSYDAFGFSHILGRSFKGL